MIGLLAAVATYDQSRGVPFQAWARLKVKSAVLDEIRRMSPVSRTRHSPQIRLEDVYAREDDTAFVENALSRKASMQLRDGLRSLPVSQGLIVLLQIHGLPLKRIAALLQRPVLAVSQESRQAIATLRAQLEENLGTPT